MAIARRTNISVRNILKKAVVKPPRRLPFVERERKVYKPKLVGATPFPQRIPRATTFMGIARPPRKIIVQKARAKLPVRKAKLIKASLLKKKILIPRKKRRTPFR